MMRVHTYTGNVKQEKNNPPVEFDVNQNSNDTQSLCPKAEKQVPELQRWRADCSN